MGKRNISSSEAPTERGGSSPSRPLFGSWAPALVGLLFAAMPELTISATLYSQPAYQSPVRAEPDDLLLLPGYGFAPDDIVVYEAVDDTTRELRPPSSVPTNSTSNTGIAPVISNGNVPDSLTIKLPKVVENGRSYALWVRGRDQQWSNGVLINDARPLWISPAYVYETDSVASLPRYLKVVGRNLQPVPGKLTQVRLVNVDPSKPAYTLSASDDGNPDTAIEHYVARVDLPAVLPAGVYTVEVSRDGVSWVRLDKQKLSVRPDPEEMVEFPVYRYGCFPNDGKDDTRCVYDAIKDAAEGPLGGTVLFGKGVWNLSDSSATQYRAGIVVPEGVNLVGEGAAATTVIRGAGWDDNHQGPSPTFTLLGRNTVQGITFKDARKYKSTARRASILQLGKIWYTANDEKEPKAVKDVVITRNVFDKPFRAVVNGGLSVERLFVTYNEFGAYDTALFIDGDSNNVNEKFHMDDSVVAFNTFKPGSYMDVSIRQGTIASQIGASRRLDFSGNTADGASTKFLYNPATDPKGWRAAFFWHLRNNQENVLVSQNTATCTADKTGDGEAIAFDNNHNTFAFSKAQKVLAATSDTVRVPGPLVKQQNGKPTSSSYYDEHWVQIAQGRGLGQVRRIVSYQTDAAGVTLTVSPAWDVVPKAGSRLTVGREFWQVYTVDNRVDHRSPLCLKSNRKSKPTDPEGGGVIGMWAQAADSVIEGNHQYDTSGITLHPFYSAVDSVCPECKASTFFQYFLEVRGNTIDHEYNWNSDCSWSGIMASYGASPTPASTPPIAAYGISIARNTVIQADGFAGGAISMVPSWWDGPTPNKWKVINNTLVHHNVIKDVVGAAPIKTCVGGQLGRVGLLTNAATVWNTSLYSNTCTNVASQLRVKDKGSNTQKITASSVSSGVCE
jgi:hypothetical protein